ncbi:MAG: hypothetical protein AAFR59_08310, partial [Bacteroidota bacterium]
MKILNIYILLVTTFILSTLQVSAQLSVGGTSLGSGVVLAGSASPNYTTNAIFKAVGTSSNPSSIQIGRFGWNTYTLLQVTGSSNSNRGLMFKVYDGPSGEGKRTLFMNKLGMVAIGGSVLLNDSKTKLEINEDATSGASDRLFFRMDAGNGSYNESVRNNDLAIIWTDSEGNDGGQGVPAKRNFASGLVLAPWATGSKRGLRIDKDGDVSIGVPHYNVKGQNYALAVNGEVICEELKVQTYANWPDYVFADDYERMDLSELEHYIEENNHLPNVPAAQVVESEGIEVAKMTTIQMEKIEELTLYILELNKRIA